MTDKVKKALTQLRSMEYKKQRIDNGDFDITGIVMKEPGTRRRLAMFREMLHAETPYILADDIFGFNRRNRQTPCYVTEHGHKIRGNGGNITPNYARVIGQGFDGVIERIDGTLAALPADSNRREFLEIMKEYIALVYEISDRYLEAAEAEGHTKLAEALKWVPRNPARNFYEACLFFKIIVYTLRCAACSHMTIGRFDQYMYPYYLADREAGVSREELLETLELFFITLNVDGDLYQGVQQGDNGQSMVLGGYDKYGNDMFNELSSLCMDASLELSLIDPKINLRVSKKTPDSLYEYGTRLTKQGLGFPQYCNDDIVVPFLMSLGYEEDDAWDYVVAACWEHIIPNCANDTPNRATMNFPLVVNTAVHRTLPTAESFDELMEDVKKAIAEECDRIRSSCSPNLPKGAVPPSPNNYLSLFIDGCLEQALDLNQGGAKYNNFGSHGAGIANAADALEAIRTLVFEEKSVTAEELLAALNADFEGYEALRNRLLSCDRMGNNIDSVDEIACTMMDAFTNALNNKPNGLFGGIWRAGTGSAMEYILSAKRCPATADGRKAGEPYGCSYSPSIISRLNGPLSVIQSFTKFDLKRIANGGPLTLEIHDTVFRNDEGEKKVAQLVKAFVHLGGHQLQLNSINRDRLLDAQEHPENYPNLIVRVWGWSGYFCELDKAYQDHVISRTEFSV